MAKNYSKQEMKEIINKANELKKQEEESYSYEDIQKIAKNMNIPIKAVKEAISIYENNSPKNIKKKAGNPVKRKIKKRLIYILYTIFWLGFIFLMVIASDIENSWIWAMPSIAVVGLVMGAFINELEGAISGGVAGLLVGLLILWIGKIIWGKIAIVLILGFISFIVFMFRFKAQIDSVIK